MYSRIEKKNVVFCIYGTQETQELFSRFTWIWTCIQNAQAHTHTHTKRQQWNKSETDKHVLNSVILDCRTWSHRHYWFLWSKPLVWNQLADFASLTFPQQYWIVIDHKLINTIESFTSPTIRRLRQRTSCWLWKLLSINVRTRILANWCRKWEKAFSHREYIVCLNHCSASINRFEKCNV